MLSGLYGMLLDKCAEDDKAEQEDPDFGNWQADMEESYDRYGIANPYEEAAFRVVQVEMWRVARENLEGVFMHHIGAMRFLSC